MQYSVVKRRIRLWTALGCVGVLAVLAGCGTNNPSGPVNAIINAEPQQGKAPLVVSFDASGSYDRDGTITDYRWEFDDGTGWVTGKQVEHEFARPGRYSVSLMVVGESGVGRTSTTVRVQNNPPVASFSFDPADPFEEETVIFDGGDSHDPDGGEIVTWMWDFGDGNTATGEVVEHAYATPGDFTVRLTVEDEHGDQGTARRRVSVEECIGGRCGRR